MQMPSFISKKTFTLRSFITATICITVMIVLLCSFLFYYKKTAGVLRTNSRNSITSQLNQVNQLILEQIESIDSVIPMFMANENIQNVMESKESSASSESSRFQVERQMSYVYYSSPLAGKNFVNSIYLIKDDNTTYHSYTSGDLEAGSRRSVELKEAFDPDLPRLQCQTLPVEKERIYFARNLYSINTGKHIGIMILCIDSQKWIQYCSKGLDASWIITLFNSCIDITSSEKYKDLGSQIQ